MIGRAIPQLVLIAIVALAIAGVLRTWVAIVSGCAVIVAEIGWQRFRDAAR
jgi:hypothetical protein